MLKRLREPKEADDMQIRGETDRPPYKANVPKGSALGILVRGIDLGTSDSIFKNQDGSVKRTHQIALIFETPKYQVEYKDKQTGEQKRGPAHLRLYVTATMGTQKKGSKLRTVWKALMGTDPTATDNVDPKDMLGRAALLTISHKIGELHLNPQTGKMEPDVREVVENLMGLPDEMTPPRPTTVPEWYEIRDAQGNRNEPPVWIGEFDRKTIQKSDEWLGVGAPAAPAGTDEEVPW
jgi:hypothetical protein